MEHNLTSFRDAADKLFKLFIVGETLMSSHEYAYRLKELMGETNIAYDTFNSLICQVIYLLKWCLTPSIGSLNRLFNNDSTVWPLRI